MSSVRGEGVPVPTLPGPRAPPIEKELGMADRALKLVDMTEEGLSSEAQQAQRLDMVWDRLRLIGAVLGMRRLLELAMNSSNPNVALGASKELSRIDEDPEVVAERLRAAPFADLTFEELEAVVQTGKVDPVDAMKELGMEVEDA